MVGFIMKICVLETWNGFSGRNNKVCNNSFPSLQKTLTCNVTKLQILPPYHASNLC